MVGAFAFVPALATAIGKIEGFNGLFDLVLFHAAVLATFRSRHIRFTSPHSQGVCLASCVDQDSKHGMGHHPKAILDDPVPEILRHWLQAWRNCFTAISWEHALMLVMGALLAPGKRTVSSCLRMTGRAEAANFATYHQILNRARWSPRAAARRLHGTIVERLVPMGPVVIGMDDTIERRWGCRITARGIYRDPVRSSHSCYGRQCPRLAPHGTLGCLAPLEDGIEAHLTRLRISLALSLAMASETFAARAAPHDDDITSGITLYHRTARLSGVPHLWRQRHEMRAGMQRYQLGCPIPIADGEA